MTRIHSSRQILDENLQIVRATLMATAEDLRGHSSVAQEAVLEAVEQVDRALGELERAGPPERPLLLQAAG